MVGLEKILTSIIGIGKTVAEPNVSIVGLTAFCRGMLKTGRTTRRNWG
jgi:hypothetical protein